MQGSYNTFMVFSSHVFNQKKRKKIAKEMRMTGKFPINQVYTLFVVSDCVVNTSK